MNDADIEILTWRDVRDQIHDIEPDYCEILDSWNPGDQYRIYKMRYPYGAELLNDYEFAIPHSQNRILPLSHPSVDDKIRQDLSYTIFPLGCILNNSMEVYRQFNDRVFCLANLQPGFNLGIYELFAPPAPYSVSAGARSLVMLPRISDSVGNRKLRKYFGREIQVPNSLAAQGKLFIEIAKQLESSWFSEVLFFSKKWFEPLPHNAAWQRFQNLLLQRAWQHVAHARNRAIFETSWQGFCNLIEEKHIRPDPYLIETLRHLIMVGQGTLPAFCAHDGSERAGPLNDIQRIYADVYGIKSYIPTILHPAHFNSELNTPLYYSLQNPTLLTSIPKIKAMKSAIDDLRDLRELMNHFKEAVINGELNFDDRLLMKYFSSIQYDYFHSDMYTYGGIYPSRELPITDPNLLYAPFDVEQREFAYKGTFIRCCVRVSNA